jgi:glycosyltransferase involved in cell wall biosynthesis
LPIVWASGLVAGAKAGIVLHGHEAWHPSPTILRLMSRLRVHYVAVSDYTARRFEEAASSSGGRLAGLALIPNCLGSELEAEAASCEPDPGRSRFEARRLLFVGRLDNGYEYKGLSRCLDAMALLRDAGTACQLTVVGDGNKRTAYEREAEKLGLEVTFAGRVPVAELVAHYSRSALLLMPSTADDSGSGEGFGLVYIEAGRCGLPSIAVRAGAVAEAISDGETGILLATGEPALIAKAIEGVLAGDRIDAWLAMSDAARQKAHAYTQAALSDRFRKWQLNEQTDVESVTEDRIGRRATHR